MASRPRSIRTTELSSQLAKSIAKISAKEGVLGPIKGGVGYFPDPGVIGFVLRDKDLSTLKLSEVQGIAERVAAPAKGFGTPATVIINKGILVGFFPRDRDILFGP